MKTRMILIMAMFLSFHLIKAQENAPLKGSSTIYKQEAGNKSLEVNFDPGQIFGSDTHEQFGLFNGSIKLRYFHTELSAYRMNINLAFSKAISITQQEDGALLELKDKYSAFSVNIQPGYEKHFSASKRLSPYIGAQLLMGYSSSGLVRENQDGNTIYVEKWKNDINMPQRGAYAVGAGIFAGVDYYFVRKLYLGLELAYGLQYTKLLKSIYTSEENPDNNYERKNGSFFGVSPSLATGNLRLGWSF